MLATTISTPLKCTQISFSVFFSCRAAFSPISLLFSLRLPFNIYLETDFPRYFDSFYIFYVLVLLRFTFFFPKPVTAKCCFYSVYFHFDCTVVRMHIGWSTLFIVNTFSMSPTQHGIFPDSPVNMLGIIVRDNA